MNYGKKNAGKRKRELSSRGPAIKRKFFSITLLAVLVIVLAAVSVAGYTGIKYVKEIIAEAPDIDEIDATPSGYMSTVLDANGNVTAQLVGTGSNRVYVTLDQIPVNLQHAFVAIEDERFYEHNGIDLKGIVRAGVKGIVSGSFSEGASTITQQLLKNNVFDGWTSESDSERMTRKLQEQYLALQLEKKVSKDWIMENYLNTINLGQNTLGVQAASLRYFGKDVSELSLSECATIAAITQNPTKYNPISHPDENNTRRQKVLENMKDQGYITTEEYEEALADNVYNRIEEVNTALTSSDTNITSYFVDAVTQEVIQDLQDELGYSEAQAYKALYSGGLTIYSTQDPDIQAICDEEVNDDDNYAIKKQVSFSYALSIQQADGSVEHFNEQKLLAYFKQSNSNYTLNYNSEEAALAAVEEYKESLLQDGGTVIGETLTYTVQPQVSMTIMDQYTGQVKAIVGGRGEKTASLTLNRAVNTTRQPGSTFKILTSYATALETGVCTLATTILDEPITYSSGQQVHNADGVYRGYTSIRAAIQSSVNVVAVKLIQEVTPKAGYEMAKKFGISTLTDDDIVESLPLGVGDVSNIEMTAAYAAIANGGTYTEPILYTKIVDHDGNVLLEKEPETHRVIKDTTAFLLTSAMEDVVTKGTGKLCNFGGMSIAGKTGTAGSTEVTTNSWFAGFTPYYTCAIWGGYDDNSDLSSTTFTKNIWNHVMGKIHEGLEDIGFSVPEGIITCTVCQTSGLIANPETCTDLITEYFAEGTEPEEVCDYHETAVICTESGMLAGEYCPETETRVYTKGSDDEENGMPTEVCNIHTEESLLDQILNQFTEWGENLGNAGTNPDASDPETPNSESTPTP